MRGSWWTGLTFALALGCSVLDAPEPALGRQPPGRSGRSPHAPLAAFCECATAQAERELEDSIDALEGRTDIEPRPGFDGCANALTGLPVVAVPVVATSSEPTFGFVERAFRDGHLASRACHATALWVALESALGAPREGDPNLAVVERSANAARRADGVAAAATGLLLVLRESSRSPTHARRLASTLQALRGVSFDGVFASDADDVRRVATRHARALGASFDPKSPHDPLARGALLPLWLTPRPTLAELCVDTGVAREHAARLGLRGLVEGDLERMMLAAPKFHPEDSTPGHARDALCAVLAGNDARALRSAREMVPRYTDVHELLASIQRGPR